MYKLLVSWSPFAVIGATQTVSSSGLQGSAQTVSFFSTPFSNASVGTKPAVFGKLGI